MPFLTARKSSRLRSALSKPISPTGIRVIRGAAAIVLGVTTTVAVAWSLALVVDGGQGRGWRGLARYYTDVALQVVPTPTNGHQQEGTHFLQVTRHRRSGTVIVRVGSSWSKDPDHPPYGSPHALVEGTSFAAEMKEKFDRSEEATAMWRADGWPLPAFSAEARWASYGSRRVWKVAGGELVGSENVQPHDGVRILPLQPIWSGLVINTVLYISLWYAVFSLFWYRNIRSGLRRRRGRCVHCGYKLLHEQTRCSECGELV